MSTDERWLPAPDWEDSYEVSNLGRVRSIARMVRGKGNSLRPARATIKVTRVGNTGYVYVSLRRNAERHMKTVHRLVARAFHGEPAAGLQVRHLDGNKENNRADNLAWGTATENAYDKVAHGAHHYAKRSACKHGHEFTPENTYYPPAGGRYCKTCRRLADKRRYQDPARRAALRAAGRKHDAKRGAAR